MSDFEVSDLAGLGKLAEKLIDALGAALGTVYRPIALRVDAAGEARRIRATGEAQTEVESARVRTLARAEAERRVISANTDEQIEARAEQRRRSREARRQRNLENIAAEALNQPSTNVDERTVDPDWMNAFVDLAEDVSNPDMQAMWARVLAAEVASPGKYSVKALQTLRGMTHPDALSFDAICRAVSGFGPDDRSQLVTGFVSVDDNIFRVPQFGEIGYRYTGFAFLDLLNAQANGLLYPDRLLAGRLDNEGAEYFFHGRRVRIASRSRRTYRLQAYVLTPVGSELAKLPQILPDEDYWRELKRVLGKNLVVSE